jgi:hypothetical protein
VSTGKNSCKASPSRSKGPNQAEKLKAELDAELDELFGGDAEGTISRHKGDTAMLYDGLALVAGVKSHYYFDDGSFEAMATTELVKHWTKNGAVLKLHRFKAGTERTVVYTNGNTGKVKAVVILNIEFLDLPSGTVRITSVPIDIVPGFAKELCLGRRQIKQLGMQPIITHWNNLVKKSADG